MRVLVVGINYPPEQIGIAVYTGGLVRALAARGHRVDVVTAPPYYPDWRLAPGYRTGWWRRKTDGDVRIIRCPIYIPSTPTGVRRILHHLSFALSAVAPALFLAVRRRPDVVLVVAPSLASAPVGWSAARLCGARAWLHIQDFEVEAAFATGLINERSRLAGIARAFERGVIRLFDTVSSISVEMCRKLAEMGVDQSRIVELRNWADVELVRPIDHESRFRTQWAITTPHVALYSGNIANKQGIEIIIDAARRLRDRHDLTFVICGNGPNRQKLEEEVGDLPNVQLHDLQATDDLCELLGLATVHLLPQKAEAADLVLPSKLTNMLASGRPIIATAADGTGLAREVAGCGLTTPPGDAVAFASAITSLLDDARVRSDYGTAARTRAETAWRRDVITNGFIDSIEAGAHPMKRGKTR